MEIRAIRTIVSIPYGKGKGRDTNKVLTNQHFVSIPYGKGKVLKTKIFHVLFKCINSLWER